MIKKLIFLLSIILIIVISVISCVKSPLTPTLRSAVPILNTNIKVNSLEDANKLFKQNSGTIFEETKNFIKSKEPVYSTTTEPLKSSYFESLITPQCIDSGYNLLEHIKIFQITDKTAYDEMPFRISKNVKSYGVEIPFILNGEKWKYEGGVVLVATTSCKDETETIVMNEKGELHCGSGIVEKWKQPGYLNYRLLRYIIDEEGTIYLAGGYCIK